MRRQGAGLITYRKAGKSAPRKVQTKNAGPLWYTTKVKMRIFSYSAASKSKLSRATPAQGQHPTFNRAGPSVLHSKKLFPNLHFCFLPSTPRSKNRNQSFHTESLVLSPLHPQLWEKVPGHAAPRNGTRKRAAIDAPNTCGYINASSHLPPSLAVPVAVRTLLSPCYVCRLTLLGRLAARG